jgi:glutaredoxin
MPANQLTLYSRRSCHLCEDMENLLPTYLEEAGLSLNTLYIDNNPILEQQFGSLVPVLKAGEKEICHYFLDVKALQQYISEMGNPLN